MLTQLRPLQIILILIGIFILNNPGFAQKTTPTKGYAAEDLKAYNNSAFSNPQWDPLVKEGFEAMDRQDMQTSIEFLRKAVNLGCKSPIVFFKLALGYESQGSHYSAIQYYELALESFKKANKDHRYWKDFDENYGRALYMMGEMDRAIPVLEKAARSSSNPWILKLLGEFYLAKNDQLQATAYFERLLQSPNHSLSPVEQLQINIDLARLYLAKNEGEAAKRYYERVLQLDPNNQEAHNYLKQGESEKKYEKLYEMIDQF